MSTENEYQPINCDDYDNLELACQNRMVLEVTLQGGDVLTGKATDLVLRKKVEYLVVSIDNELRELRLDAIISYNHPDLGTVVIDHSPS
ncbi:Rho-binding antiterminator [Morganella psychrotolerans]|uniref:Rho-binding antiterminator n=1 Tax=Morganella psychrotolerans TaxID=368603 RepID=A0A1B8HMX8_9GAMM|nr:Rho-binding antiterminator [Morganella psychrotolerans]OBU10662.1 Rho-binding antiterminator [Morganella psychrotolerans]